MSFAFDTAMGRIFENKADIDMLVEKLTSNITDERTLRMVLLAVYALPITRRLLIEELRDREPRRTA